MTQSLATDRDTAIPPVSAEDRKNLPRGADQFGWTAEQKLVAHRNMNVLFPTRVIRTGGPVNPLPRGEQIDVQYEHRGERYDIDAYMAATNATGLLAIKNGEIIVERYTQGNTENTLWASRSMGKSFCSTLVGMAIRDGYIKSVDEPVSRYVPELTCTLYENVTIRQSLQMVSGVPYTEDYRDPSTDVFPLQACTVSGKPGSFAKFLVDLASRDNGYITPPGSVFNYSSADSVLNGLVVERATGMVPPVYIEKKLWQHYGMERDSYWNMEAEDGSAFSASGYGATLRDYGRFGQFILGGGVLPDGTATLPEGWMQEALMPSEASLQASQPFMASQWWLHEYKDVLSTKAGAVDPSHPELPPIRPHGSESMFYALGSSGQVIAINPVENVVIVKWAVWTEGRLDGGRYDDAALINAIIEAVH